MRTGRLSSKVVLITGAAHGIGLAMARLFAAEGATVVIGDIDEPHGRAAALTIDHAGGIAEFVKLDVTDEASVEAAILHACKRFGRLDILVNDAGGPTPRDGPLTEFDLDDFWRVMRTNLLGTVLCCRHAIPVIAAGGGGAVLNMGSIVALRGTAGRDAYTAAKGGVHALTQSLAVEFASDRVRVNCIAPGAVTSERAQADVGRHLLGIPEPEEVASLALYLVSDESRHVTGTIVSIDGGRAAAG
jgi:NAD(P)-dependent dehydrogenase (short-subunit alcohol dehydrogenase family)